MWSWNELGRISLELKDKSTLYIDPDPQIVDGCGINAVHDLQLSEFPREKLTELTEPFDVFDFDWSDKRISDSTRSKIIVTKAINNGTAQVRKVTDVEKNTECYDKKQ